MAERHLGPAGRPLARVLTFVAMVAAIVVCVGVIAAPVWWGLKTFKSESKSSPTSPATVTPTATPTAPHKTNPSDPTPIQPKHKRKSLASGVPTAFGSHPDNHPVADKANPIGAAPCPFGQNTSVDMVGSSFRSTDLAGCNIHLARGNTIKAAPSQFPADPEGKCPSGSVMVMRGGAALGNDIEINGVPTGPVFCEERPSMFDQNKVHINEPPTSPAPK